ncbi:MAG: LptE family protein [Elusimicrobiota bacterium]
MNKKTALSADPQYPPIAFITFIALIAFSGCAKDQAMVYNPSSQTLPSNIKRIAMKPFVNKTQQFALEDKLTLSVNNRFLTDGTYKITSIEESDGILEGEIMRYIHIPVSYDSNFVATQYKMDVIVRIQFVDKASNQVLWDEPNLVGTVTYPVATAPGGMTEEQARELAWDRLSKDILKRTIQGFGSVTGESQRKIAPIVPSPAAEAPRDTIELPPPPGPPPPPPPPPQ